MIKRFILGALLVGFISGVAQSRVALSLPQCSGVNAGKNYELVATSNIIRGKLLHILPDNSVIDGLTTLIDGVRGEVVWPNLVPDAVADRVSSQPALFV